MLQKLQTYKVWSNAFYVAPFVLAVYFELWPTAMLSLAVCVFGMLYHLHRESRKYLLPDLIASWSLIGTNLVLCYIGGFTAPYFWIALLFVALALFYDFYLEHKSQYSLNHGLWHLYGSLITIFCILTYIL